MKPSKKLVVKVAARVRVPTKALLRQDRMKTERAPTEKVPTERVPKDP